MSREPVIRIESDIIVDITFFVWYYYYTENEQKGLLDLLKKRMNQKIVSDFIFFHDKRYIALLSGNLAKRSRRR
jgi:hypothetical protein